MSIAVSPATCRQFVCFAVRPSATRPGKTDKFPVSPHTGEFCSVMDPSAWSDEATARATAARLGLPGIGFVFTDNDPYFFIDIDGALTDRGWSQQAVEMCQNFDGCYVEVSQSGTGLHIIGRYSSRPEHGCRNQSLGLELYTGGRFCALTGTGARGSFDHDATDRLTQIIPAIFPKTHTSPDAAEWTSGPCVEWSGPTDDADLLQRMLSSRPSAGGAFGGRATVQDLWAGNADALGQAYPDSRPEGFDRSSADAALCAHLAFWTGKDCERMDRLFRQSGLMRDKWDNRPDYRVRTIGHAVAHCQRVYGTRERDRDDADRAPVPGQPEAPDPETGLRVGHQFMSIQAQIDHFSGCIYIRDLHRMLIPDGGLLKPEQFRATYGGYLFSMDMTNDKSTRSAWEAFTESSGYHFPKVHEACFRPELKPGAIVEEEGRSLVNTYVPITTPAVAGDAGPFLRHVEKLLPDPDDRAILMAYLAAMVQYPGHKFQWCPLIQGVQGNGKTLLITAMAYCVGNRYTHFPNPEDISNKFNAWILGKLFIGIEEVYVADRRELVNVLKPLVTNRRVDIQGKGADQKTGDNRANFLMTTNHRDAMMITDDDRRYAPFFTAQQHREDLERDGMGGNYFPDLYRWADTGGYAIINYYLRSYPIPDALNPATSCHRAPVTSSLSEAKRASMGSIEQEVMEAIEESRPGFAGGWISSLALDRLLDERKLATRLPRAKRRDLLQSLGYEWHPALQGGRVNNQIVDAGGIPGKPKLYLRRGHIACNLRTSSEVVRVYLDAQSGCGLSGGALGQNGPTFPQEIVSP